MKVFQIFISYLLQEILAKTILIAYFHVIKIFLIKKFLLENLLISKGLQHL